jgi:hypothetical protein
VAKEPRPSDPNDDPELRRVREHLRNLPWDDLYPRLLLAALGKIGRMVWRGEFRGHVPGGRSAHDFVNTAVEKFLAGERQWNWDNLDYENLWGATSGIIGNWVTGVENRTTSPLDPDKVVQLPTRGPTPEDDEERRSERARFLRYLGDKDEVVARMAQLILDLGLNGPELAEVMRPTPQGLTRQEINDHKKNTQREIDNNKKKLRKWTAEYLANHD